MSPDDQNWPDPNYPTKDVGSDPMRGDSAPDDDEDAPESEREAEEQIDEEDTGSLGRP